MIRISIQRAILLMILSTFLLASCNLAPEESATYVAATSRPNPTLSVEQRERKILELIQTNNGCALPCWWGITSGATTLFQTQAFLGELGITMSVYRTIGNITDYYVNGDDITSLGIHNGTGLTEQDGIVANIEIDTSSNFANHPDGWLEAWSGYSPKQIISKYGAPDRLWLMSSSHVSEPSGGPKVGYELWLFYDHLKFLIQYSGLVEYAPVYRFCPEYGPSGQLSPDLKLFLADPADPTPLESLSNALSIPGMTDYIVPVEKATGLTVKQVSSLLIQSGAQGCFDARSDNWP